MVHFFDTYNYSDRWKKTGDFVLWRNKNVAQSDYCIHHHSSSVNIELEIKERLPIDIPGSQAISLHKLTSHFQISKGK